MLGWGSLLWDKDSNKYFDYQHDCWKCNGPTLKLEFSRISSSRDNALTLVIDPKHGSPVTVAWSMSLRTTIEEAVCDLQKREGPTKKENIGMLAINGDEPPRAFDKKSLDSIRAWAVERELEGVVWTDLRSNFYEIKSKPFSIDVAVDHLKSQIKDPKAKAIEYIKLAPSFVQTQLRTAIDSQSGL